MRESWSRALCAAIVVLLLAGLGSASVLQLRSPDPVPADAAAIDFSAERAWEHLERIAEAPHPIGSQAHEELRHYLQGVLGEIDGTLEEQAAAVERLSGFEIRNQMIRFPGTDPTGAVLLATHYDSVPSGPGVGDAGVSVAALLETARALGAGGPLRNDVIVLLTDAEEAGLFGAAAFVDEHPWAADVDLVFNFEGRGVSGPPVVVETEEPTTRLLSGIFEAAPPLSTSPVAELVLPEDYRDRVSDFGEFRRLGIQGAHFAIVGESLYYHTPLDDLERSSRRTLQHVGETALGLAREFGAADLDDVRGGPRASWSVATPGLSAVAPAWVAWPLLAVAIALAVRVSRRTVEPQVRNVVLGLAVPLLSVVAAAITGWLGLRVVGLVNRDARRLLEDLPVGWHQGAGDLVNGHLVMWGFVALAAALVAAGLELARRRIGAPLLLSTSVVAWTFVLAVATVVHAPTAAAFAGPLVAANAAALLWTHRGRDPEVGVGFAALVAILGAPVVMLGASMTWMGYLGNTLTGVALLCVGSAVALGQLVPQLDVVGRANRWMPTALFASIAVLLLATAALTRSTDGDLLRFIDGGGVVWG